MSHMFDDVIKHKMCKLAIGLNRFMALSVKKKLISKICSDHGQMTSLKK